MDRRNKRLQARKESELNTVLNSYVRTYLRYIDKCQELDLQQKELSRLDKSWVRWLKKNNFNPMYFDHFTKEVVNVLNVINNPPKTTRNDTAYFSPSTTGINTI